MPALLASLGWAGEAQGHNDLSLAGEEVVQAAASREFTFQRRVAGQEGKHPWCGRMAFGGKRAERGGRCLGGERLPSLTFSNAQNALRDRWKLLSLEGRSRSLVDAFASHGMPFNAVRARQSERLNMCRYFLEGSVIVERWWGQALCKNNLPFWIGRSPACTGLPHHLYSAYSNCDGIPQVPPTPRVPEMVYRDGFQQPRIPLAPLASLAATPFSCVASSRCCPDGATAAWISQHVVFSDGVLEANHLPLAQQLVPELQRA